MRAPFEMNEGRHHLEQIIGSFPASSAHWNEAQNRFHFVDRLLTECLGWERADLDVEVSDGAGGRIDYTLGRPIRAVLEAKREAELFETLPVGKPTLVRKLQPLLETSKSFAAAVRQVIPYCALKGAQIAIVCNGPQLALFQTVIPGTSPLDGECYLFNGFASYLENFSLLWSLLSPEGISENRAYRELALHRSPRIPEKASTGIPEPNRYRYRNDFQENLRGLSSLLLEEIEDNPDLKHSFYKECYVASEANNRHLLLSKNIISARYKRVGDDGIIPAPLSASVNNGKNVNLGDPTVTHSTGSRPVVVIGDVGVGKTSFFENLYENLDNTAKANTYFIYINLGTKASLSSDIKSHVLSEIPDVLNKTYKVDINDFEFVRSIYHNELASFDKSVKGALKNTDRESYERERINFLLQKTEHKDAHLHASLGHLARGRQRQIILVLDNADQRSFEVQQESFLIAQELAATRNLLVFIALRPSTFYQSKSSGALSAYQNKLLTIAPPPADEVVEKRLTFAVRVAEGKVQPAALSGIRLELGNVVSFLNATLRSIRRNDQIRQFLSNITGGNTRSVIELITSFCGSPNVDSKKIVQIESEQGNYTVPLHEFTKHALLGEYAYFNSLSSLVACNIFDVSTADPREHFLASLIVAFLNSTSGSRDLDGFVSGHAIIQECLRLGFVEDQTRFALRRLAKKRLIETPHAHFREIPVADREDPDQFHFRATSVGVYHTRFWTGSFAFMDATSTDTPIFDPSVRSELFKLAASFEIKHRYWRATFFQNYLEGQWHSANIGVTYYDFSALTQMNNASFQAVKGVVDRGSDQKK